MRETSSGKKYTLPPRAIDALSKMMWRSERKRLFEIVCERIKETGDRSKARIAERIAIETGIKRMFIATSAERAFRILRQPPN